MSSLCVFASDADASRREASTGMHLFLGAVLLLYLVKSLVAQFSDDTFTESATAPISHRVKVFRYCSGILALLGAAETTAVVTSIEGGGCSDGNHL